MCALVFEFLSKPNLTVWKKIKYHLENSLKIFLGKIIKFFYIIIFGCKKIYKITFNILSACIHQKCKTILGIKFN